MAVKCEVISNSSVSIIALCMETGGTGAIMVTDSAFATEVVFAPETGGTVLATETD